MSNQHFFRRKPTAVVLIILTIFYGVFAPLNIFLGSVSAQRGDQQLSHALYWGAFWNAVVATLCFTGWRLIRRQSRNYLAAGACAVLTALFIVIRVWIVWLLNGRNPFPLVEAILTWLPMLYAIVYALRETKHKGVS